MSSSTTLKLFLCAFLIIFITACGRAPNTTRVSPKTAKPAADFAISKEKSRLKKARDFNPKNMFGEEKVSNNDRLNRLERMVQNLRNDFDNVSPSIKRLMVLEGDLQTLISELQEITQITPNQLTPTTEQPSTVKKAVTKASQAKPVAKNAKGQKIYNKTPPALSGQAAVYDVRVGEHKTKTRIVIDVNAKTSHSVSIDNTEGLMIVELPNVKWQAAVSKNYKKSGFLKSYIAEKASDGNTGYFLIFQLKKNAQLSYERVFPSLSGGGAQRIVLDLSAN